MLSDPSTDGEVQAALRLADVNESLKKVTLNFWQMILMTKSLRIGKLSLMRVYKVQRFMFGTGLICESRSKIISKKIARYYPCPN